MRSNDDPVPSVHEAATAAVEHRDAGQPVDAAIADRVGGHLGTDLSHVWVHADALAQEATEAMGARAFAYGGDVFLGPGESGGDARLMAHELTHVAQQEASRRPATQRQVQVGAQDSPAEHEADQVAAAVTGGSAKRPRLLVDDGPVGPGQMLKSQFLEQLRAQVQSVADTELGPVYTAIGCPYIDQYFGRYTTQPAAAGEALLHRFAPASRAAQTAAELFQPAVDRVREGVRQWRDTGKPPPEIAAADPAVAAAAVTARPEGGRETLGSLEADLGPGQPLEAGTASRMSAALGTDVSHARVHSGAMAARKAADAGATAFAVGDNVVLGAGAPAVGTIAGDALLAHELAHTIQQHEAAGAALARMTPIGIGADAAEEHADHAAAGAVARLHGDEVGAASGGKSWLARIAGWAGDVFNTGIQLQRCSPGGGDGEPTDAGLPGGVVDPTPRRSPGELADGELGGELAHAEELAKSGNGDRREEIEREIEMRLPGSGFEGSTSPTSPGNTKVAPDVALQILENLSKGEPPFKPELGKGGASWFVTEGNPYTGVAPDRSVNVEVEIAKTAKPLVLGEQALVEILEAEARSTAAEAEATFRQRFGLESNAPLNSRLRKALTRFQQQFAESRMWDQVAARVKSAGGVGEVVLEPGSRFSRSGSGKFAVVTDAAKVSVKGGPEALVTALETAGASAEAPILEAARELAVKQKWAGRVRGAFRYGGRVLIVVAIAADVWKIYHARDVKKAIVESAGGWAGATVGAAAFATWFAPADAAGPWAWAAHGVGTLVAGGVGYWVGSETTRYIYELVAE